MEKVLELVFKDAAGDKKIITVDNPKDDVTAEQAKTAMNAVISANVFENGGSDLKEIVEARVRTTEVTVLE